MGCRILESTDGECVFYCSTTGWAFGPLFPNREAIEKFEKVYTADPRGLEESHLMELFAEFTTRFVCECDTVRDDDEEPEPDKGERYRCADCKEQDAKKKKWKRWP